MSIATIVNNKDYIISTCYLFGIAGIMSGEVLISVPLIALAAILGNLHLR